MKRTLLQVKGLNKSFGGIKALQDIDLTINENEIRCFAGINGSGKSTFVKCVSGVYQPEEGEIIINGNRYTTLTPDEAIAEGVQVIYQDLSLFQNLTIAENIAINSVLHSENKLINWNNIYRIAQEQLDKIGVSLDLNATIQESTMATQQIVAICRALVSDARLIFMDEPTTALTGKEVKRLIKIVYELKNRGYAIVFISHKLDEIFEIADNITVFRDGKLVGNFDKQKINKKKLSFYMTGRNIDYPRYRRRFDMLEDVVLDIKDLTQKGNYENICLDVRKGDILGLTGLLGAGRTELGLTLFGLNKFSAGRITFNGYEIRKPAPEKMKKLGMGLLPEDRSQQGLFSGRTIKENISSASLNRCVNNAGLIDSLLEYELGERISQDMNVKTESVESTVSTLSGGNQQKVVVGKWEATNPKLFIMDSPTVGIDVGSKAEIYEKIQTYASQGMAIILISDEIEEIVNNCNRIIVMSEGKIVARFEEEDCYSYEREDLENRIFKIISESEESVNNEEKETA